MLFIPCARQIETRFIQHIWKWVSSSELFRETTDRILFLEDTPNRIDWSINAAFNKAVKEQPKWFIRLDMDVWPATSLDNTVRRLQHMHSKYGAEMVGARIRAAMGNPHMSVPKQATLNAETAQEPYEATFFSGGFTAIHQDLYNRWPIRGHFKWLEGNKTPVYVICPMDNTEDADVAAMALSVNAKVWVDTELLMFHKKSVMLPPLGAEGDEIERKEA